MLQKAGGVFLERVQEWRLTCVVLPVLLPVSGRLWNILSPGLQVERLNRTGQNSTSELLILERFHAVTLTLFLFFLALFF